MNKSAVELNVAGGGWPPAPEVRGGFIPKTFRTPRN